MNIDFAKGNGLVPAIIQDVRTRQVLMLGYMNQEAYDQTVREGKVTFYSRSKQRIWTKGETSGNELLVKDIELDCDSDTLLIQVRRTGPVCHTGTVSCFGEEEADALAFLRHLSNIIRDRREHPVDGSYTSQLFEKGLSKIAQKVGEEAVELVIEAVDDQPEFLKNEAADLLYHLLVLLEAKNTSLDEVVSVLAERHK